MEVTALRRLLGDHDRAIDELKRSVRSGKNAADTDATSAEPSDELTLARRSGGEPRQPVAMHAATLDPECAVAPSHGLKRGLAASEVLALLGRPTTVNDDGNYQYWTYANGRVVLRGDIVHSWSSWGSGLPVDLGAAVEFVPAPEKPKPGIIYTPVVPKVAANGSYFGEISATTGRPKTVYVRGYTRKDGTYVRSHYRSSPR